MNKILKYVGLLFILVICIYSLGPKVQYEPINFDNPTAYNFSLDAIDSLIAEHESSITDIKDDNEAKIIWAGSVGNCTEYSIVYLHGFSASHMEGAPIHKKVAKHFGANLFLSRLYDHGRSDTNSLKGITPALLYESAEKALEIGKVIGKKVIVMSCSTGGTLDIMLSKHHPEIFAHIMYSPNLEIYDPTAAMVTWPWGEQIMEAVMGGEYVNVDYKDEAKKYWNEKYHNDGILTLQYILDNYMNEDYFSSITQPLFVGVYYKDESHQDEVISIAAAEEFYIKVGTPSEKKKFVKFANADRHVILSSIFSEDIESVEKETIKFMEDVLKLQPINK